MRDAASPHSADARAVPLKNIIAVGGKRIIVIDDEIASKLCLTDETIIEQHIIDRGILMKIRNQGGSPTGCTVDLKDDSDTIPVVLKDLG